MTFFTASIQTVVLRFFLLMAVVIASFSFGVPYLAILALPIFLSSMLAVSFTKPKTKKAMIPEINVVHEADYHESTAA